MPVILKGTPEPLPARTISTLRSAVQIGGIGLASVTIAISPARSVSARRRPRAMFNVIDSAVRAPTVHGPALFPHSAAAGHFCARTPCTELPRIAEDLLHHTHHTLRAPMACAVRGSHHDPGLFGTVALHVKVKFGPVSSIYCTCSDCMSPGVCCKEWHKHNTKALIPIHRQDRCQI